MHFAARIGVPLRNHNGTFGAPWPPEDPPLPSYDDRHRRVLETLLLNGPLTFEALQAAVKMRRVEGEFGLVLGDLAEAFDVRLPSRLRPIEYRWSGETRLYRIKPSALASCTKR